MLGYNDYRNFEAVIAKAKTACFNSGQRMEDHFVDITEMVGIGKGGQSGASEQRPYEKSGAGPAQITAAPRSGWRPDVYEESGENDPTL